ncbi:MAG: hypothetical protein QM802_07140 [Agriterribacter sp.]
MKKYFTKFLLLITLFWSIISDVKGQDNRYEILCPHSATRSYDGKGLVPFYTTSTAKVKLTGSIINKEYSKCSQALLPQSEATTDMGWGFIKVKNEKIPAMGNDGKLHYDKPFDASYMLYYNSDKDIQKTWWAHEYNNPEKRIRTYNKNLVDIYRREAKITLNLRDDIALKLKNKKFIIAEYSGTLNNKADFIFSNTLFIKSGVLKDNSDYGMIIKFYNDFAGKFENLTDEGLENRIFLTTLKGKTGNYIAYFKIKNQKLIGELLPVNTTTESTILTGIKKEFSSLSENGVVYVYGDNLLDLGKAINKSASENNILLLSRNTSIKRTFNQTEAILAKFRDKKLDNSNLSFINGTPSSFEDATFQSFDNADVEILKKLKTEIDNKASGKISMVITSKEQLIQEITQGNNDVLFIVAHCDEKNMYFGSSKISLEELNSLPNRTNKEKERVAILFSCLTGNLFDKRKPFLPFFKKNMQSFSEVLIEKNYFDLIISPPTTINGAETLKMIDILDKYTILELREYLNKMLVNGEMYNIVKK